MKCTIGTAYHHAKVITGSRTKVKPEGIRGLQLNTASMKTT